MNTQITKEIEQRHLAASRERAPGVLGIYYTAVGLEYMKVNLKK